MVQEHFATLSAAYARLKQLPVEQAEMGALVLEGVHYFVQQGTEWSEWGSTPFTEHFFHELATVPQADGSHWFNLFEDLVVLFREQALLDQAKLPEIGKKILDSFESGEWEPGDGTLVSDWYWNYLPARCACKPLHGTV